MEPLLFLAHRLPYPPNKGDKIRSFHLLQHLARSYRVHLGCFIDDPADAPHVKALSQWCASSHVEPINPRLSKVCSLRALATGDALSLAYYRSGAMARWVRQTVQAQDIRRAFVFCSSMAQYLQSYRHIHTVVDFVDVDSAKWTDYAPRHRWPMSWLYRREGEKLLESERDIATVAGATLLVTPAEVALFETLAPESRGRVCAVPNGVDAQFFSPSNAGVSPYPAGQWPVVFTGAMDYWPNVDAVDFFAREVLPALRARIPHAHFYIVGMNPSPAVKALGELAGVSVTGRVEDVRPYVAHAGAAVAPLRVARGIQNKVLEAMALARPVVVSRTCADSLEGCPGEEFLLAGSADEYVQALLALHDTARARAIGDRARARVLTHYSWGSALSRVDALMTGGSGADIEPSAPGPALHA